MEVKSPLKIGWWVLGVLQWEVKYDTNLPLSTRNSNSLWEVAWLWEAAWHGGKKHSELRLWSGSGSWLPPLPSHLPLGKSLSLSDLLFMWMPLKVSYVLSTMLGTFCGLAHFIFKPTKWVCFTNGEMGSEKWITYQNHRTENDETGIWSQIMGHWRHLVNPNHHIVLPLSFKGAGVAGCMQAGSWG